MNVSKTLRKINDLFYHKGLGPIDINNGHCYHWAYIAYRLVGGKLLYTDACGGHAWLYLNNKHYDSECLKGTDDYNRLPIILQGRDLEDDDIVEPKTISEFKERWRSNGRYGWKQQMCSSMFKQIKKA